MSTITIPDSLVSSFVVSEPSSVRDESGKVLGYYTPIREATAEDYEWAKSQFTAEEIEFSLNSGPPVPFKEAIDELRRKYGPA